MRNSLNLLPEDSRQPASKANAGCVAPHVREAFKVLLKHYFEYERWHFERLPPDERESHVFEHWLTVLNWLTDMPRMPENIHDEPYSQESE